MQKLVDGVHNFQRGVFGSQREFFQRLVGGAWSNSFTLETIGGEYRHRRFLYAPFGGAVTEIGPPVIVRVQ